MPYLLALISIVFLLGCAQQDKERKQDEQVSTQIRTVEIHSLHELNQLFEDLNYTTQSWKAGLREVPRLYFSHVTNDWKKTSDTIPVKEKKNIFFRLLGPLVLMSNEAIMKEREQLLKEGKDSKWSVDLALKYKVIKKEDSNLSTTDFKELIKRVDIIPPSLALAQGAEESGWGTSRFASEGNALFGQWDFSGKGMKPAQQRKELGNYGLARFDTPLASVEAYMLNLNTTRAYEKLRTLRQQLRQNNEKVTGIKLAQTLNKYSERGEEYIKGLSHMITYNHLETTDDAYLKKDETIHLKKAEN